MNQLTGPRAMHSRLTCFRPIPARNLRRTIPRVRAQQSGKRWDSEAETAAQVRRLIRRDKKEFLGAEDLLQRFEAEFGEGKAPSQEEAASTSSATTSTTEAPESTPAASSNSPPRSSLATKAAAVAAAKSGAPARFTGSSSASPFGGPVTSSPFGAPAPAPRSKMEPQGLSPSMNPDPVAPEPEQNLGSFLSGITLTQIVIVLSFTTIIGLMVATFTFVYNVGAIKLAGVD